MGLDKKNMTELRGIAQSLGVKNVFSLKKSQLIDKIKIKSSEVAADTTPPRVETIIIEIPQEPVREPDRLAEVLSEFISRGLRFNIKDTRWYMGFVGRTDEGGVDMPIRAIIKCAERLINAR